MAEKQKAEAGESKPKAAPSAPYTPRLKTMFDKDVRKQLTEKFGYTNVCLLYTSPSPRDS